MDNLFAYTEAWSSYPGYVSLNVDQEGRAMLSVRSRNGMLPSVIEVTPDVAEQLATALLVKVARPGKAVL